jgi:UDP-N-acetylglucosamine acyltransferase
VHASAIVEPSARLAPGVVVGPLAYVGHEVSLGEGTELLHHASVVGPAVLGSRNQVHAHAVIGGAPQDRSYRGEATRLEVGDDNVFREHVTVHRGTGKGGGLTRIGSQGLFMAGAHVAHDCLLGDRVTLTNNTSLGGHVVVEDGAVVGGHVAVAPFVRLGTLCFVAGGAMVERSVPPYVVAAGDRARIVALNRVGLDRAGVPAESRAALKETFRQLFRTSRPLVRAVEELSSPQRQDPRARALVRFVAEQLLGV